ncbi:hypothetical protein A2U01_0115157, partial [Trifolium medium]|nr:hypothetical protein [Trifolium medium]
SIGVFSLSLSEDPASQQREIGRKFTPSACCSKVVARVLAKREGSSLSELWRSKMHVSANPLVKK